MLFLSILQVLLGVSVGLVFLTLSVIVNYCLFYMAMGVIHQQPTQTKQLDQPNTDGRMGPINRPTGTPTRSPSE